jgi:hypothetical protein
MWHIKKRILVLGLIIGMILAIIFPVIVSAQDNATIIIIMQPANSTDWTNIGKRDGISTDNLSELNGSTKSNIGKINGVSVNK